jgi:hypothetical protein
MKLRFAARDLHSAAAGAPLAAPFELLVVVDFLQATEDRHHLKCSKKYSNDENQSSVWLRNCTTPNNS